MLIGYARVSTEDQETVAQESALKQAGCKKIFPETASGGRWDRLQLARALDQLRAGDVLVVWKLDRLSRSLKDLLTDRPTRRRLSQLDRSNRHDDARRTHDDADDRIVWRV